MAGYSSIGEDLRGKISTLITWKSEGQRAPHKPLLLLLALGYVQKCHSRLLSFSEIERQLRAALRLFGPKRNSNHPEYPFWHLTTDGIWEVSSHKPINLRPGSSNPYPKELRDKKAEAGFVTSYYNELKASYDLQMDIIHDVLDAHFPSSIHEDILAFFELRVREGEAMPSSSALEFRKALLLAYDRCCAVTDFSVSMNGSIPGVEVAYILWPQAGGDHVIPNAIAMTTLHRKLFHLGVFTLDEKYRVRISAKVNGRTGFEELLGKYEGKKIHLPPDPCAHPDQNALEWHRQQVFRG